MSSRVHLAEKIAYLYIAPFIVAVGLVGSVSNLVVLSSRKRFGGRLFTYLKERSYLLPQEGAF
jgi:hypothetical protein